jgi:hypothetical protein
MPRPVRSDGGEAAARPDDAIRSTDYDLSLHRVPTDGHFYERRNSIILTGMPTKLNTAILTAAIAGFEQQKKRLDAHIAELRNMLSPGGTEGTAPGRTKRRRMSAAARARIAAAQRKRWAAARKESGAA